MRVNISIMADVNRGGIPTVFSSVLSALESFEARHHCLDSCPWHITIIDRPEDELFLSFSKYCGTDRGILFISEKCETVPRGVIVSTPEDTYERTVELLNQMFGKQ